MPTAPPSSPLTPPPAGKARLLSGTGGRSAAAASRTGTRTAAADATFPATVPDGRRPHAAPAPGSAAPAAAAPPASALPRWLKGFVIGGVLLAIGMPSAVLLSRSMLVQATLAEQGSSKATLVCIGGQAHAVDGSSVIGWLFGGSYFACGDWETREARQQRERELAHSQYMARERARQMAR